MNKFVLALLLLISEKGLAQQNDQQDKKIILEKVNLFFKALETRDTVLYHTLVYPHAQIWTIRPHQDTFKIANRTFREDMVNLATMNSIIEERPTSSEIKIHNNIAMVWAPYTLSLGGKFSHCGVDVFTLLKSAEGWKIVSTVYSVEPDGCASLKNQ